MRLASVNEGKGAVKDLVKYVLSAVAVMNIPVHNQHLGTKCGVVFSCADDACESCGQVSICEWPFLVDFVKSS